MGDQRAQLKRGELMAIATGAIFPEGADALLFYINEEVKLPEKSFEYIFFVKIAYKTANSMGREMKLFDGEYNTAKISASPRSSIVERYVVTNRDIGKSEQVNVFLFN
jgi:hypothetical protein